MMNKQPAEADHQNQTKVSSDSHMQQQQQQQQQPQEEAHSTDYAPYPKLDPNDVAPPPQNWSNLSTGPAAAATTMPAESNPYVSPSPVQPSSSKNKLESVKGVLSNWGKKAADATKKAEDLAGNMWQHYAAVGRIAQKTKVLAEGGYEKIYRQSFDTVPEEQLLKTYACYLSTSAGPVVGVLYLSTVKLAFCSDDPLSYKVGEQTQWSYYKVVIPLNQLKAVNPSTSKANPAEKYIQVISVDNHEFWFMGFVHYDSAVKNLLEALSPRS